jgi:hypothetical protein
VCSSSTGNTASVPDAGVGATYAWTISSGSTITSADPQTRTVTYTAGASGTVVLGCTVTSAAGCSSSAGSATVAINSGTLTPYVMSSGDYLENFADIANWHDGFTCGNGANRWSGVAVNATGTIPDGTNTTVATTSFASGTSQGVQRGTGNIVLLATGPSDNTTASAIDLNLDFTCRNAGTLGFDWAEVNNSTGDRKASLRVYTSTDGTTWTELVGAAVLNFQNTVASSGNISAVALPSSFNNNANARIRFYIYNGTGGTAGSRPKISIDNVAVTSTAVAANDVTYNETKGQTFKIAESDLLTHASSGATLTAAPSPSANGVTFTRAGGFIFYNANLSANDSFTYTVAFPGGCATASGTVTVTAVVPGGVAQSITYSAGGVTINFAGIPTYQYEIQRSATADFSSGYTVLTTVTAPADGLFSYTDTSPLQPTGFYRTMRHF